MEKTPDWYNHLTDDELLPLIVEADKHIEQAQGQLDNAVCAREALVAVIRSRHGKCTMPNAEHRELPDISARG